MSGQLRENKQALRFASSYALILTVVVSQVCEDLCFEYTSRRLEFYIIFVISAAAKDTAAVRDHMVRIFLIKNLETEFVGKVRMIPICAENSVEHNQVRHLFADRIQNAFGLRVYFSKQNATQSHEVHTKPGAIRTVSGTALSIVCCVLLSAAVTLGSRSHRKIPVLAYEYYCCLS